MSGARHWEQDKEATVYIGNLDERVSDALVWELMLQAGRIVRRPGAPHRTPLPY